MVVLLCHLPAMPLKDFSDDPSSRVGLAEYCALRAPVDTFCFDPPSQSLFGPLRLAGGFLLRGAIVASIGRARSAIEGVGELLLRSRWICRGN